MDEIKQISVDQVREAVAKMSGKEASKPEAKDVEAFDVSKIKKEA